MGECGCGKYKKTIVVRNKVNNAFFEIINSKLIFRKRKFYKRDKQGYYYIPEVMVEKN